MDGRDRAGRMDNGGTEACILEHTRHTVKNFSADSPAADALLRPFRPLARSPSELYWCSPLSFREPPRSRSASFLATIFELMTAEPERPAEAADPEVDEPVETKAEKRRRLIDNPWVLWVAVLHLGLLGIPLYWKTRYSVSTRLAIIGGSIAYTLFAVVAIYWGVMKIIEFAQVLGS